jgi:segregation and condensation protein B
MSDEGGSILPFPGRPPGPEAEALVGALEAMLFAVGEPVRVKDLAEALDVEPGAVRAGLSALGARLGEGERGLVLHEVAGGWQLRTHPRYAQPVGRLKGARPQKLSRAALEVLSVVAYEQPATKGDVDRVRGVDSGAVLRALLDRGLIRAAGRREEPGRPLQYATTPAFMEMFSLPSLDALPTLKERAELDEGDG